MTASGQPPPSVEESCDEQVHRLCEADNSLLFPLNLLSLYCDIVRYTEGRVVMPITTISAKGWVVIPKKLREEYGLHPGQKVHVVDVGERLYLIPVAEDPIAAGYGRFRHWKSGTEELLEERRREREREAKIAHWTESRRR